MDTTTKLLAIKDYGNVRPKPAEMTLKSACALLERDNEDAELSWHYEIRGMDEVYHFYMDVDKYKGKPIEELLQNIADYFQLDPNDIKATKNNKKEFSHHIDIPKLYGFPVDIHHHIKNIVEKYGWDKTQYDCGVYPNGTSKKKNKDETGKEKWVDVVSTRLYRLPNQGKPSKDNTPFDPVGKHIIMNGNTVDFIPDYITDDAVRLDPAPVEPKKPRTSLKAPANPTKIDKVLECLSVERADEYLTWSKVGWAIYNVGGTVEQFKRFSEKSLLYDEDSCEFIFERARDDQELGMGTLITWAKEDNPELYEKLFPRPACLITDDCGEGTDGYGAEAGDFKLEAAIFSKGMREMCAKVHKYLYTTMRYCLDKWYAFNKTTFLWEDLKNPSSRFVECFNKFFNYNIGRISKELMKDDLSEEQRKQLLEDRKLFMKACEKYDTCGSHSVMKTHFSDLLCDNEFVEKLDILIDCIAFKNGIFNLKTKTFKEGIHYHHYLTTKLPYDYKPPTVDDLQTVETTILEICSNEKWRYDYYKTLLGYFMTGRASEHQAFFSMTGIGSNGKSFMFEILSHIFKPYVVAIPSNTFEVGQKDYNKNISLIVGKRLVWINELSKKTCDADKLKAFSDGTAMNVPYLYQQHPVLIKNNASLVTIGNQNPRFHSDGGIDRRIRSIDFVSRFYRKDDIVPYPQNPNPNRDFWADSTKETFLKSIGGIYALFEFIAQGAQMYFTKGLETPDEYKELTRQVLVDNNRFIEFIEENFEIVEENTGVVHKSLVLECWKREKGKECNFDDIRAELIRRKFIYDPTKAKRLVKDGPPKKGCFTNMRIINTEPTVKNLILDELDGDYDDLSSASTAPLSPPRYSDDGILQAK